MKEDLMKMVEAILADDTEEAKKLFKVDSAEKINKIVLGEKYECEEDSKKDDDDKDDDKDEKKEDKDDKDEKKDDDKEEVDESLAHAKSGVEDKEGQYHGYRHNHDGEVYHKVVHKDDSEGYGHEKSRAKSTKLKAEKDSGAHEKKGAAYKDKVHKADNSQKVESKSKGSKGLKTIAKDTKSPDSDGNKENRRTDKTAKYHGTDRGGKEV